MISTLPDITVPKKMFNSREIVKQTTRIDFMVMSLDTALPELNVYQAATEFSMALCE